MGECLCWGHPLVETYPPVQQERVFVGNSGSGLDELRPPAGERGPPR